VRNYVSNVLAKLHAADRTEAALRARDAGMSLPRSGQPHETEPR
jgi:DNA-binding NarL/FixJ family response regulator